jgi:hypothetical protein
VLAKYRNFYYTDGFSVMIAPQFQKARRLMIHLDWYGWCWLFCAVEPSLQPARGIGAKRWRVT